MAGKFPNGAFVHGHGSQPGHGSGVVVSGGVVGQGVPSAPHDEPFSSSSPSSSAVAS